MDVNATTEKERQEMANQIPLGRHGRLDEIMEVVRWLVIESPPYLMGAITQVAGA
jgi:hypothetical protein